MPPVMAGYKSVLMTPDPYHTPGYGGFCPQFKYQIGETFGRTTSRLLTDDKIASSGRLVLAGIQPGTSDEDRQQQERLNLIQTRTQSWGDQKLAEQMVPGYTGFIPKSQHYFGKRYAKNCTSAISDFESSQRGHQGKIRDLRVIEALQSGKMPKDKQDTTLPSIMASQKTPLKAVSKEVRPLISKCVPAHTFSPYYMNNSNENKRFMSGYTGFVPRSRGLLGMGYPLITHVALNEFTDDLKRLEAVSSRPVSIHQDSKAKVTSACIYPVETGLVPHYTGHIPGWKFRYGQTFGHSTKNALSSSPNPLVAASI